MITWDYTISKYNQDMQSHILCEVLKSHVINLIFEACDYLNNKIFCYYKTRK